MHTRKKQLATLSQLFPKCVTKTTGTSHQSIQSFNKIKLSQRANVLKAMMKRNTRTRRKVFKIRVTWGRRFLKRWRKHPSIEKTKHEETVKWMKYEWNFEMVAVFFLWWTFPKHFLIMFHVKHHSVLWSCILSGQNDISIHWGSLSNPKEGLVIWFDFMMSPESVFGC